MRTEAFDAKPEGKPAGKLFLGIVSMKEEAFARKRKFKAGFLADAVLDPATVVAWLW